MKASWIACDPRSKKRQKGERKGYEGEKRLTAVPSEESWTSTLKAPSLLSSCLKEEDLVSPPPDLFPEGIVRTWHTDEFLAKTAASREERDDSRDVPGNRRMSLYEHLLRILQRSQKDCRKTSEDVSTICFSLISGWSSHMASCSVSEYAERKEVIK